MKKSILVISILAAQFSLASVKGGSDVGSADKSAKCVGDAELVKKCSLVASPQTEPLPFDSVALCKDKTYSIVLEKSGETAGALPASPSSGVRAGGVSYTTKLDNVTLSISYGVALSPSAKKEATPGRMTVTYNKAAGAPSSSYALSCTDAVVGEAPQAQFCANQAALAAQALANGNGSASEKVTSSSSKDGKTYTVILSEEGVGTDKYQVKMAGEHDCLVQSIKLQGNASLRP